MHQARKIRRRLMMLTWWFDVVGASGERSERLEVRRGWWLVDLWLCCDNGGWFRLSKACGTTGSGDEFLLDVDGAELRDNGLEVQIRPEGLEYGGFDSEDAGFKMWPS